MRYAIAAAPILATVFACTAIVRYAHGYELEPCKIERDILGHCDTANNRILPPAQYLVPFKGQLVETRARDMDDMAQLCSDHPLAHIVMGCAIHFAHTVTGEVRCYIYLAPDDYLKRHSVTADAVRLHEIAHCMGWPSYHPR